MPKCFPGGDKNKNTFHLLCHDSYLMNGGKPLLNGPVISLFSSSSVNYIVAVIHKPATYKIFEKNFLFLMHARGLILSSPKILDMKIV